MNTSTINSSSCTNPMSSYTVPQAHSSNYMEDGVYSSYPSQECFNAHMEYQMLLSGSLFTALSLAREVNRLNGYKVVSDYTIVKVKNHFRQNEMKKKERSGNGFINFERDFLIHRNSGMNFYESEVPPSKRKYQNAKDAYSKLQKGYMQLLSTRI